MTNAAQIRAEMRRTAERLLELNAQLQTTGEVPAKFTPNEMRGKLLGFSMYNIDPSKLLLNTLQQVFGAVVDSKVDLYLYDENKLLAHADNPIIIVPITRSSFGKKLYPDLLTVNVYLTTSGRILLAFSVMNKSDVRTNFYNAVDRSWQGKKEVLDLVTEQIWLELNMDDQSLTAVYFYRTAHESEIVPTKLTAAQQVFLTDLVNQAFIARITETLKVQYVVYQIGGPLIKDTLELQLAVEPTETVPTKIQF